jgi:hypothetical protein
MLYYVLEINLHKGEILINELQDDTLYCEL